MERRIHQLTAAALSLLASSLSQAQEHMFRTWFDAPESVIAGETFQVWMWASYEVDGAPEPSVEGSYLNGVYASIEVTGSLATLDHLSPILDGFCRLESGRSDGAWLRDFILFQGEGVPGVQVNYSNPLPVAMFDVTTVGGSQGVLDFFLRAPSDMPVPYIDWRDSNSDVVIATVDPGTGDIDVLADLVTTPISVRVVPAPPTLGLLALAPFAGRRRR